MAEFKIIMWRSIN